MATTAAQHDEDTIRSAFEQYRLMVEIGPGDWPDLPDLRGIARRLGVPYVLLMLENQAAFGNPYLTIKDLAEWESSPAAQRVLAEAWAQDAAEDAEDAKQAVA